MPGLLLHAMVSMTLTRGEYFRKIMYQKNLPFEMKIAGAVQYWAICSMRTLSQTSFRILVIFCSKCKFKKKHSNICNIITMFPFGRKGPMMTHPLQMTTYFSDCLPMGASWPDCWDVCSSSYKMGLLDTLIHPAPGNTWAVQKYFHLSAIIFTAIINVFTLVTDSRQWLREEG